MAALSKIKALINIDMIGDKDLDITNDELVAIPPVLKVWQIAASLGDGKFFRQDAGGLRRPQALRRCRCECNRHHRSRLRAERFLLAHGERHDGQAECPQLPSGWGRGAPAGETARASIAFGHHAIDVRSLHSRYWHCHRRGRG